MEPVNSCSLHHVAQPRHSFTRNSSAGAYHHPFVSNFVALAGYHVCGMSRMSLCWFLSEACWSLWSDSMSNRALHRTCLVAVSHPRTSARNCRSSGVASLSSGCRAPVTSSIQLSPSACTFNNWIPTGFLRLPCVRACVLEVIHVWHRLHLTWTSDSLHSTHDLLWHVGQMHWSNVWCRAHLVWQSLTRSSTALISCPIVEPSGTTTGYVCMSSS